MNNRRAIEKSTKLHSVALDFADEAFFARRSGDADEELRLTRAAYDKESKAAAMLRDLPSHYMHSKLHLSAALFGYRCGEFKAAEQLLLYGLLADPGDSVSEELYELLAKVRFRLSLKSEDLPLENDEITMTWQGPDADSGFLEDTALSLQVKRWGQLIRNTASYENGLKITDSKKINRIYRVLTKPPAKGSYKITLKLIPIGSQQLPGFEMVERIHSRILLSFDKLKKGHLSALQSSFDNDAYFHDFMERASDLAPDGKTVTALSLEAGVNGRKQTVLFDRTRTDLESVYRPPEDEPEDMDFRLSDEVVTVSGELKYADARTYPEEIELIEDSGEAWRILMPLGFDETVVNRHYKGRVQVTGRHRYKIRKTNRMLMEDIQATN